jgi:hypothetical protein
MPTKLKPCEESRWMVQVVLRASTSSSPDFSASNRSLVVVPTYLTFLASPSTAEAIALQ